LLLVLSSLISFALPVEALSLQEQSWISHLKPKMPKPKGKDSFPAQLNVKIQNYEVVLRGTCALEGQLTDEDLVEAMKKAAGKTDGYKSPEDAVTDKLEIDKLKNKLDISGADRERMINNLLSLVGMDKVASLFKGEIPNYGGADATSAIIDAVFSGELPGIGNLIGVPTSVSGFAQGAIIGTVFTSIDEYKHDQQRWSDIVELANTRARFREFNGHLNSEVKEKMRKNTKWTIRIQDQVINEQRYREAPGVDAPYIYTSDIVLKKTDDDYENPVGTYKGAFKLDIDVDLSGHDAGIDRYFAKYFNDNQDKYSYGGAKGIPFEPVSKSIHGASESKYAIGSDNAYITLENPIGGVYEMKLDATQLDVLENKVHQDYVVTLKQENDTVRATYTWTEIFDSETGTSYIQNSWVIVVKPTGETQSGSNTDDDPYPNIDVRGMIGLTLVVDMIE
ncbi:MAG: hypothetical protein J6Z80_02695, partial [Clostridia bacterium]|nr:hypothetical protein [Clostridia bacterium]